MKFGDVLSEVCIMKFSECCVMIFGLADNMSAKISYFLEVKSKLLQTNII